MAPIRKGDGTGVAPKGISQVRTGDGRILFDGPAIPDSVLTPESNDLDHFNGDTDNFTIDDSPPTIDTNLSVKSDEDTPAQIISTSGLNRYPERGEQFGGYVQELDPGSSLPLILFGVQDASNFYGIRIRTDDPEFFIVKDGTGSENSIASSNPSALEPGEWFDVEVDWTENDIIARIYSTNSDGSRDSQLDEITASNETEYDDGGIGLAQHSASDQSAFDHIRVTDVFD